MARLQDDLDRYPMAATVGAVGEVPVIDVAALANGADAPSAKTAVELIADACRNWGFFQVINHGIDAALIGATWEETRLFFEQSRDAKETLLRTRDNPWGYYNNELTKNQRDKKEVFDFTTPGPDPIYDVENRWPAERETFRVTLECYRDAVTELGLRLLQAFCVGLDLRADFMHADFASRHTGFVRLNYYPVADPMKGSQTEHLPEADLGVHHHTDAGALTVLMQDDVGGLQVFREGYWYDVPPVPNAFVINTGDMMQIWSNDTYRAAIHRVLAMDQTDRYSIPFFFNPTADSKVSPLPTVVSRDNPARYRTVAWSDFRSKRTDGDYADYGPEVQIAQYRI